MTLETQRYDGRGPPHLLSSFHQYKRAFGIDLGHFLASTLEAALELGKLIGRKTLLVFMIKLVVENVTVVLVGS